MTLNNWCPAITNKTMANSTKKFILFNFYIFNSIFLYLKMQFVIRLNGVNSRLRKGDF